MLPPSGCNSCAARARGVFGLASEVIGHGLWNGFDLANRLAGVPALELPQGA